MGVIDDYQYVNPRAGSFVLKQVFIANINNQLRLLNGSASKTSSFSIPNRPLYIVGVTGTGNYN